MVTSILKGEEIRFINGKWLYSDGTEVKDGEERAIKPPKGGTGESKQSGKITIGIELEGYEKIKGQLRNLEATTDRILEKQKLMGIDLASGDDFTVYNNGREQEVYNIPKGSKILR